MIIQQLLFGGAFSTHYPHRSKEIHISQRQRSRAQTPRDLNTSDIDHHKRASQR
jgi:excisionase family DNA binding protein